ncbi:cAMP-dependent protein kinase type 1 [Pycnococcus provasolii]
MDDPVGVGLPWVNGDALRRGKDATARGQRRATNSSAAARTVHLHGAGGLVLNSARSNQPNTGWFSHRQNAGGREEHVRVQGGADRVRETFLQRLRRGFGGRGASQHVPSPPARERNAHGVASSSGAVTYRRHTPHGASTVDKGKDGRWNDPALGTLEAILSPRTPIPATPAPATASSTIPSVVRSCAALKNLSDDAFRQLRRGVEVITVEPRAAIVNKGVKSDAMYVIVSGSCSVEQVASNDEIRWQGDSSTMSSVGAPAAHSSSSTDDDEDDVTSPPSASFSSSSSDDQHTAEAALAADRKVLTAGDYFGEMALTRHGRCSETVRAIKKTTLWRIRSDLFHRIGLRDAFLKREEKANMLMSKFSILSKISYYNVLLLCDEATDTTHEDGSTIIHQGTYSGMMHFLVEGNEAVVMQSSDQRTSNDFSVAAEPTTLWTLNVGDYFGEIAIMTATAHTASVVAVGNVRTIALPARACTRYLFPHLQSKMAEMLGEYQFKDGKRPTMTEISPSTAGGMRMKSLREMQWVNEQRNNDTRVKAMAKMTSMRNRRFVPKRFLVGAPLGRGATGRVFVTKYAPTGEVFALKVIDRAKHENGDNPHGLEHLRAEIALTSTLSHPAIIGNYASFQCKRNVYIVMELASAGSLSSVIRSNKIPLGSLSESSTRVLAAEILLGLQYLHDANTIHRDLKPANILLDSGGHAKIADFGLAKHLHHDDGRAYTLVGTVEYIAPEVLHNRGYGKPADLWSFGIILYQMCIGRPPFRDAKRRSSVIFEKVLGAPIEFPVEKRVGTLLQRLVHRILQRDVDRRPRRAENVRDDPFWNAINWRNVVKQEYPRLDDLWLDDSASDLDDRDELVPLYASTAVGSEWVDATAVVVEATNASPQGGSDVVVSEVTGQDASEEFEF